MIKFSFKCFIFIHLTAVSLGAVQKRVEDGLAITHPRILRTLQQRASGVGVGIGYYFDAKGALPPHISNKELSSLPGFKVILASLESEVEKFKSDTEHKKWNTVGVGVHHHSRLFDRNFLKDERAVFSLIGVINRMDLAYENPETCGEIRLIYRLAYRVAVGGKDKSVASRLPFTLNLILNAKSPESDLTCRDISKRWEALKLENLAVSEAANLIFSDTGVLSKDLRDRSLIKKVEINLQLARKAAAVRPDFGGHAVYLLKVFDWDHKHETLVESVLKNQVSRSKAEAFYKWLFEKLNRVKELDKGTLQIPDEFLDSRAYSIAPGGLSRTQNHPLYKKLSDDRISLALSKIDLSKLINIKSVEGFKRRITDISCTGCHQTRAIGGFHFMGQDPSKWSEESQGFQAVYPGNSVVVPGSGHFFADLQRRKLIQKETVEGVSPNYDSGFSSKPQQRGVLNGELDTKLGIVNGWGAHCFSGNDPSFNSWTCSEGTKCKILYDDSTVAKGMGVCSSHSGEELGDPTEEGVIKSGSGSWYADKYKRTNILFSLDKKNYVNSPQSPLPNTRTGGFPGGSIRLNSCEDVVMSKHPEALCGALPAAGNGFNKCIFNKNTSFEDCLQTYSKGVGLRRCSRENPCRDDYICVESLAPNLQDSGVCVPPYFLFQFRVDGHPIKF